MSKSKSKPPNEAKISQLQRFFSTLLERITACDRISWLLILTTVVCCLFGIYHIVDSHYCQVLYRCQSTDIKDRFPRYLDHEPSEEKYTSFWRYFSFPTFFVLLVIVGCIMTLIFLEVSLPGIIVCVFDLLYGSFWFTARKKTQIDSEFPSSPSP
jgi:hypothetical protein